MKKFLLILTLLFAFTAPVYCTDVVISTTTIPSWFSQTLPASVTGTASVTNASATVTQTVANGFRPSLVGLSGFRLSLGGVDYVVSSVSYNSGTSTGTFTLSTTYASTTGSVASTLYPFILLRFYPTKRFQPLGASYIVQPGTPGTSAWFRQYACSVISQTVYLPEITLPATRDAVNPQDRNARYAALFYQQSGGLISSYAGFETFELPANATTTWTTIFVSNNPATSVPANVEAYSRDQVDALLDDISGTTSTTFSLGTGTASSGNNFTFRVSSDTNKPAIRFNGSTSVWEVSNNGTTFNSLITGNVSGTTNAIVKFTAATTLGNSSATDDGSTYTFTTPVRLSASTTYAGLPAAGSAGKIGRVSNLSRGLWMDNGTNWFGLSGEVFNVKEFGAIADGTTNDTTAVQAAITAAAVAGGVVYFPAGTYRINGQLTLPNDGGGVPKQKAVMLLGAGASHSGRGAVPNGGTILDMRDATSPAKIDTRGEGLLVIRDITFKDDGADSNPFIHTTNTTLHITDCEFHGSGSGGTGSTNDAIILGGTGTTASGLSTSPFQGYGTVIDGNYFNRIRIGVHLRTYANAVVIRDNTWWNLCGGTSTNGAIVIDGDVSNSTVQAVIDGNLFEVTNYPYTIYMVDYTNGNQITNNGFYDPSGTTLALIRLASSTVGSNFIGHNYYTGATLISDNTGAANVQTILDSTQSGVPSKFPLPLTFTGTNRYQGADSAGAQIYSFIAPTSYWYEQVEGASGQNITINHVPLGAAAESVGQWQRASATDKRLRLAGSSNNILLADGTLRIYAADSNTLFLGTSADASISITAGVLASSKATGTAPLTIASTTKVSNLNVDLLDGASATTTPTASAIPIADGSNKLDNGWINFAAPAAIGGTTPAAGSFTTISASGQITSTVTTGTAPLVIASTTNVANLNASSLSGATFAAPGTIGGTTPGAATFTTLTANTSLTINAGTAITKVISATASLDFTALAANSCETLTITVTGAANGDTVILGVPDALADVDGATERTTFFGWVSASNTVSVRRCNITGTVTAEPAAATVRASVIQH